MKLKLILLILLLLTFGQSYSSNITILNITNPIAKKYHKYELGIDLGKQYSNPYDPEIISVEAHFISPSGVNNVVYGFFYQPYSRFDIDSLRNGITPIYSSNFWRKETTQYPWRIRFSPNEVGNWQYYIIIKEINQEPITLPTSNFDCVDSDNHGFLKTSLNKRYLEFSNGETFFGKGEDHRPTYNTQPLYPNWPNKICDFGCYSKGTLLKNLSWLWNLS